MIWKRGKTEGNEPNQKVVEIVKREDEGLN